MLRVECESKKEMVDELLEAVASLQEIVDDEKAHLGGGLHLRLCAATKKVYDYAKALKKAQNDEPPSEDEEEVEVESDEESDEEPRERTEDDMECNELSEMWEWQFDFGRPNAVRPLEDLIDTILIDDEHKRVCAAVRVLNRAVRGSKPDDPADAERILQWKEELVGEGAIKACAQILQGTDSRDFEDTTHEEHWLYSSICDEILELFQRLGEGDALFRTKLRRNGALKGVKEHHLSSHLGEAVLDMLQR